jgi:hypothetical protein
MDQLHKQRLALPAKNSDNAPAFKKNTFCCNFSHAKASDLMKNAVE